VFKFWARPINLNGSEIGLANHISKNQKKILENLELKPNMITKDIAEMVYGKIVNYETKEFSSIYRSLITLEKHGIVQRVHVQLSWKLADKNARRTNK
jgi:Fe2+ or Zn2+ uptake regulation protein